MIEQQKAVLDILDDMDHLQKNSQQICELKETFIKLINHSDISLSYPLDDSQHIVKNDSSPLIDNSLSSISNHDNEVDVNENNQIVQLSRERPSPIIDLMSIELEAQIKNFRDSTMANLQVLLQDYQGSQLNGKQQ
eukprot:403361984